MNEGEKGNTDEWNGGGRAQGGGQVRLDRHTTLDRPTTSPVLVFVSPDLGASPRPVRSPFVSFYNRRDV